MSNQETLFDRLESNNKAVVEEIKQNIRDLFSKTNEPWLVNGLYELYLNTNSVRCMEMLMTLKEPHQQFLFERIGESIRNPKLKLKVQGLTLLGHIVSSHPIWLYKLPDHTLFRDLLRLLTTETDLVILVSALLVLIVLLPMFPASIGKRYLHDIFEIFKRFAAWNSHVPGKLVEDQMIHLQVALYALFLKLYGMYPCNFLHYLQLQFKDENNPVFCHTIKPMMDTVKMHPSLVTTSRENETTTERWKKMGVHDVIVECEKFSLDMTDRCPHETCQNTTEFRSRSSTMNSTIGASNGNESSYHQQNLRSLTSLQMWGTEESFFSPSQVYHVQTPPISESVGTRIHHRHIQSAVNRNSYPHSQEGSPPEAAIEATPETTPIRDFSTTPVVPLASKSNVARALTSFRTSSGGIVSGTPTNSVPSSPMRKEQTSPFIFPTGSVILANNTVQEVTAMGYTTIGTSTRPTGLTFTQNLAFTLSQERLQTQTSDGHVVINNKPTPSSPLKILNSEAPGGRQRIESPVSLEDEEVRAISANKHHKKKTPKICKGFLPDVDDVDTKDTKDIENGSPCSAGGLHMPNSKTINKLKKRIQRYRFHSQCNYETEQFELSTGSSPGNAVPFVGNSTVRRANSCPDMKKSPQTSLKDNKSKPFDETDEETVSEDQVSNTSNGVDYNTKKQKTALINTHTQTDGFWPMPYEHLFLTIFPSSKEENSESKSSPAGSPGPIFHQSSEQNKPSLYDILDKYIESCGSTADNNSLKNQLQLVHQQMLFERHRRETHAYRNRRLLSDAKSTRLMEEYNAALRDQVQLKQREIDELTQVLDDIRRNHAEEQQRLMEEMQQIHNKCKYFADENATLRDKIDDLETELASFKKLSGSLDRERQDAQAALVDAFAEVKVAKEQVLVGEKLKHELQRANRELLLKGELHVKYQERLDKLESMRQVEEEMKNLKEAFTEEIKALHQAIEGKSASLEVYKVRVIDLEHQVTAKEDVVASQKRLLALANEQAEAQLEAVESKYETQLKINRVLEEKILELRQQLEVEAARRKLHSPDTSSCHEVQVTTTAGLSPHSSPPSASLASSVGSNLQDRELRHLQASTSNQDGSEG